MRGWNKNRGVKKSQTLIIGGGGAIIRYTRVHLEYGVVHTFILIHYTSDTTVLQAKPAFALVPVIKYIFLYVPHSFY